MEVSFKLLNQDVENNKKESMMKSNTDSDVQFYWCMIAVDLDQDVGQTSGRDIQLWITVQGFSTARAFVEQYKKVTKKSTRKSNNLRQGLK